MRPFYALIIPQGEGAGGGPVDPGYGKPLPPEMIWGGRPGDWVPRPPLGTWGGSGQPFPTPPIVIVDPPGGGPPLVIWGGGNAPFPTPPIVIELPKPPTDAHPEHPIELPGKPEPGDPPRPWGGSGEGFPTPPIVIQPPPDPSGKPPLFTWKVGWREDVGWVVVGVPNFPHPTPSAAPAKK